LVTAEERGAMAKAVTKPLKALLNFVFFMVVARDVRLIYVHIVRLVDPSIVLVMGIQDRKDTKNNRNHFILKIRKGSFLM